MSFFLAADCGGSKASICLCDEFGKVVARAQGGPSNVSYQGIEKFLSVVKEAIQKALIVSGFSDAESTLPSRLPHFQAAWFGISGIDTADLAKTLALLLAELISVPIDRCTVANDTFLLAAPLVHAAIRNPKIQSCVCVVAGTGSIAASFRLVDGIPQELARSGGWGWVLGDEGSGFHVGKEAVRHLLREYEHALLHGKDTPTSEPENKSMRSQILSAFGVTSAPDLLALVGAPDGPGTPSLEKMSLPFMLLSLPREKRLSQLSPIVFRAAFGDGEHDGEGDPLALSVLRVTSDALAEQITHLLGIDEAHTQLKAESSIIVFGGSLVGISAYRDLIINALKERGHVFSGTEYVTDAAATGALALCQAYTNST